jgi:hypothetical protein
MTMTVLIAGFAYLSSISPVDSEIEDSTITKFLKLPQVSGALDTSMDFERPATETVLR